MTENITLIGALVGLVIPVLVALVTNRLANTSVKGAVLLALSAANGFLLAWQADPHYDWKKGAITTVYTFAVSVAVHFGLLKDVVTGKDGFIQRALPTGVGAPKQLEPVRVSRDSDAPEPNHVPTRVRRSRAHRR
jgi:predicted membrane-bound spermidine synthase